MKFGALAASAASAVVAAAPPNIIVVFADDFAFDIATYGAPTTLTPNLGAWSIVVHCPVLTRPLSLQTAWPRAA